MSGPGCACGAHGKLKCDAHVGYAMCRERGPLVDERFGLNFDPVTGDSSKRVRNDEYVYCTRFKGHDGDHAGLGFAMKRVTFS